jgi:hypothetical protein
MSQCPEIDLPPNEEQDLARRACSEISTSPQSPSVGWEAEKDLEKESLSSERHNGTNDITDEHLCTRPIEYHYLTFSTTLSRPAIDIQQLRATQSPVPRCPNLTQYVDPFDWSSARKNTIIWISCTATVFTAFTAGSYSPGLEQMTVRSHSSNLLATAIENIDLIS